MKKLLIVSLAFIAIAFSCKRSGLEYPVTMKQDITDEYFGTEVPDPYHLKPEIQNFPLFDP